MDNPKASALQKAAIAQGRQAHDLVLSSQGQTQAAQRAKALAVAAQATQYGLGPNTKALGQGKPYGST